VYEPNYDRVKMLRSTLFKIRDHIKLLSYGSKIGILEPLKKLAQEGNAFDDTEKGYKTNEVIDVDEQRKRDEKRIANFKSLVDLYGFDKDKTTILLDARKTSAAFINYCLANGIHFIDFSDRFKKSNKPTTLIYDHHWNAHGRELIAEEIASYLNKNR
ncbi:MAG: hypothetical protein HKN31_09195, partial [Pricia sp.]|nr:hypothetical protein [Pricia sp.]